MKHKLLTLEIGRFIAALLIMFSHMIDYVRISPQLQGAGFLQPFNIPQPPSVVYFFVLSGFVMITAHGHEFGRRGATWRFFWRRACRIYPAYWVVMILPLWLFTTPWPYWLQLTSLVPMQTNDYDGVAWTLRYEMAFYLFFGLGLLPVVGRYILAAWIAVVLFFWLPPGLGVQAPYWLAVIVSNAAQGKVSQEFFYSLDELFIFGMLAGQVYRYANLNRFWSWAFIGLGLICLFFDVLSGGFGFSYGFPNAFVLGGAGFGSLMLGLAGLEGIGRLRLGGWARELGKISYPLYVLHPMAILLVVRIMFHYPLTGRFAPVLAFLMMLGLTVIGTIILTYIIDQPLQKFLKGMFRNVSRASG